MFNSEEIKNHRIKITNRIFQEGKYGKQEKSLMNNVMSQNDYGKISHGGNAGNLPSERPGSPWLARAGLDRLDLAALGNQPSDLTCPGWLDLAALGHQPSDLTASIQPLLTRSGCP